MFRSQGVRFIAVGILALIMFIPLGFVSDIVQDRARYSRQANDEVSREWGGPQLLSGPLLVIPVTEDVTYDRRRQVKDRFGQPVRNENGFVQYETYQETVTEARHPVHLYPTNLDFEISTQSERRNVGIFTIPVFTARAEARFDFDTGAAGTVLTGDEVLDWDGAELLVYLSDNRALRGEALLEADGDALPLEPIAAGEGQGTGIFARPGDPRETDAYRLALTLNGARSLSAAAVGRTTRLSMTSDWPDPRFDGTFLPDTREVTEAGFTARWTVPHLARPLPLVSRENVDSLARKSATMGADFITPNDFYQKAYRAARYGILFIALTFLTILLLDRTSERPAHPVQYLMIGLAQAIFVLLMVSYAEQIGFGLAYLLSSSATVGLITLFGATALRLGRRTAVLFGMLAAVYGVLYLILRSTDYALLAGSTLAFLALAGTMILTRDENWHGPERTGGSRLSKLLRRTDTDPTQPPQPT